MGELILPRMAVVGWPANPGLGTAGDAAAGAGSVLFDTSFTAQETLANTGVPPFNANWLGGATDGGGWWQDVNSNPGGSTPGAFASGFVAGTNDDLAVLKSSAVACPANFWMEGTLRRVPGYFPTGTLVSHEVELLSRFNIANNNSTGYEFIVGFRSDGVAYCSWVMWQGVHGVFGALWDPGAETTPILLPSVPVDGDVFRIEVVGVTGDATATATLYWNGTQFGPTANTTTNSGLAVGAGALPVNLRKDFSSGTQPTWDSGQPGVGFWPNGGSTLNSLGWKRLRFGAFP